MTSVAKTLGANSVAPKVMENLPNFNVISVVQPDSAAIEACLKFAGNPFTIFKSARKTKKYYCIFQTTMHFA